MTTPNNSKKNNCMDILIILLIIGSLLVAIWATASCMNNTTGPTGSNEGFCNCSGLGSNDLFVNE